MKVYDKNDVDVTFSNWFMDLEQLTSFSAIPIQEGATHGDIIKAMFPGYHVQINTALESVNLYYEGTEEYTGSCIRFDLSWWNAPYKN